MSYREFSLQFTISLALLAIFILILALLQPTPTQAQANVIYSFGSYSTDGNDPQAPMLWLTLSVICTHHPLRGDQHFQQHRFRGFSPIRRAAWWLGNKLVEGFPLFVGKVAHICNRHRIGSNETGAGHEQQGAVQPGISIEHSCTLVRSTWL